MLQACVQVLREWGTGDARTPGWSGAGRPAAIISLPSRGKPALVESLARGISEIGRMPYLGQLQLAPRRPYRQAGAATVPTGSPESGTAWWWGPSWRKPWPESAARA